MNLSHTIQGQHNFAYYHQEEARYQPLWTTTVPEKVCYIKVMLPMSADLSAPPDVRNVSDDRIHPQQPRARRFHADYETTADGDVVIVQPSFEESSSKSRCATSPLKHHQDRNTRSPQQDLEKQGVESERNPASPSQSMPSSVCRHTRNLSAHFFDATSLNRDDGTDSTNAGKSDDRKHRRLLSNDLTNPNLAHRRINSIGNVAPVSRRQQQLHLAHGHRREDSAGLDILSAAVDVTNEELAQAAGEHQPWEHSGPCIQNQAAYDSHRAYPPPPSHPMHAPSSRPYSNTGRRHGHPAQPGHYLPVPTANMPPYTPGYSNRPNYFPPAAFPHRPGYPVQQYPSQYPQHPPHGMMYPPERRSRPERLLVGPSEVPSNNEWSKPDVNGTNQGSQTFLTAMAIGGNKTLRPSRAQGLPPTAVSDVPTQINHHRRMSSFSSIGLSAIFGPSPAQQPTEGKESHSLETSATHHRATSSSVSFLNQLDVVGMEGSADETFLRNLQESSNVDFPAQSQAAISKSSDNARQSTDEETKEESKLASGGTSKRVRRKCTIGNCPNRVVQGGLCISHGAKRKTCKHPGCNKNVKKMGLCSTHGPSRKRCDMDGCEKVAVQGGRCIAHGAKKKLCSFDECCKQAILNGMCKKHHDQSNGSMVCKIIRKPKQSASGAGKSQHTRGLSIFHDISADAVQSLLNAETKTTSAPAPSTTSFL